MRVPERIRTALAPTYNRWLAFRASRERSVKNVARANTRESFEEIYGSRDLLEEYLGPDRLAFFDEVAERCAKLEPRRVVDVGCGTGHLLAAIVRRVPKVESLVGVDYAATAIERLHEVVPQARGCVSSVYDLDLAGERFDLVLCTEVLEHLDRPADALRSLRGLCAEGGRIVVTVPDGDRDDWEAHVNFWNARQLEEFLAPAGATTVERTKSGDLLAVVTRES